MDCNKQSNKKQSLNDDVFTNQQSLQYPTEDDFVDIKVLNNNTKILNETKADISSLLDVAKETTPKNIENIAKNVQSTTNAINTNITNIKNTVNTINSNVNNINSNVGSNLQQVAKERSQYSIEDKVKQIEESLNILKANIIDRKKWFNYPNLRAIPITHKNVNNDYTLISSVTGSGHLLCAFFGETFVSKSQNTQYKEEAKKVGIKIEIDGQVAFHVEFDPTDKHPFQNKNTYSFIGIMAHNDSNLDFISTEVKPYYVIPNNVYSLDLHYNYKAIPFSNMPLALSKNLELSSNIQKITETNFFGAEEEAHSYYHFIGKIISNDNYLKFNNSLKIYIMNHRVSNSPEAPLNLLSLGGRIVYSLND